MMEETEALPACLTDPSVLYVESNDWGDMLYMVQKRLDGTSRRKSGWFVVTVAGDKSFWDGPYTLRKALARFDQQLDCLQAVLGHVGALESADDCKPLDRGTQWDARQWEQAWQVATRRLTGAPEDFAGSAEVQSMKAELDRTFLLGDADRFCRVIMRLVQRSEAVSRERGIEPWWYGQALDEA